MEKSANKLWRESGTTLSFKEWINRENQKKEEVFVSFLGIDEQINKTLQDTTSSSNLNKNYNVEDSKTILGLNKGVILVSSLLIIGSLGYLFYSRLKDRK